MRRWYVVSTQPRAEFKALANLRNQGYRAYLPRYLKWRSHARRREQVPAPLFPRYLFVALDVTRDRWRSIRSTMGVCDLVAVGDRPAPVPPGVVEEILAQEDSRGYVTISRRTPFHKGAPLRVVDGAFADCVGLFEYEDDDERVIVLLELLGRQVRVRVPLTTVTTAA